MISGTLVLHAQREVLVQPVVRPVHDQVDGEGCGGPVRMGGVVGCEPFLDLGEPFVELLDRPRVERGHGADHAGGALRDDEIRHRDDEERRADQRQAQPSLQAFEQAHGRSFLRFGAKPRLAVRRCRGQRPGRCDSDSLSVSSRVQHEPMDDAAMPPDLLARLRAAREAAAADPFGDPVLLVALDISRAMDEGRITADDLAALIAGLARDAAADRAARLARYAGLGEDQAALAAVAARLVRPDPDDSPVPFAAYREAVERPRFAAVFTAHPTFSLPPETGAALAAAACGAPLPDGLAHRPAPPTLEAEFDQAAAAIARGRDALDALAAALIEAGQAVWGDRALALQPRR
jgi:hypothetical protein